MVQSRLLRGLAPLFAFLIMVMGTATLTAQNADKAEIKARLSTPFPEIQNNRCASHEHEQWMKAKYPEIYDQGNGTTDWIDIEAARLRAEGKLQQAVLYNVPIIFHIIHNGGAENIAATYVNAQLEQLNNDFRKIAGTSGDGSNPVAVDSEIEFCAAALDPNGAVLAEPGINRIDASAAGYGNGPFATGTIDGTIKPGTIWDPTRYFNVWVMELSGGLLGYAQFPSNSGLPGLDPNGGPANTDGVVILYSSVGSSDVPFPGGAPYDEGRTLTHEAGHWFGLRHIWGDGNCGDDFCNDTPTQQTSSNGCPNTTTCDGVKDQVENYMDYSYDACMNMFSNDQKTRMQTVMSVSPRRMELANSTVCNTMPMPPVANFSVSSDYSCVTPFTVQFNDASAAFPAVTAWSWTFPGGTPATSTAQNPIVTYNTAGTYDVTLTVTNSEGTDSQTQTNLITIDGAVTGIAAPVIEDFQMAAFPPAGWSVDNPDGAFTWERTTAVGYNSSACMYMNFWDYDSNGQVDDLNLPGVNTAGLVDMQLTFDLAYALYSDIGGGFSDTLEILVSTDCGATYASVYKKFEASLVTAPNHPAEFFPANNSEWRNEVIDLSAFDGESNLVLRFRATTDWENNMFIDNVNINGTPSAVAPMADFTNSITGSGCETVTVQFNDNSTNGPTSWDWTFPGGTPASSTAQNPTVTYNGAGSYGATLVATNGAGNDSETQNALVTVEAALTTSAAVSANASCNGAADGSASVTANGPGTFTYNWSNGGNSAAENGLAAGIYTVDVTDSNGCISQEMVTITEPSAITTSTSTTDADCTSNNGTATVTANGGTVPFSYLWNDGQMTATAANLAAGTYTVVITDANGCTNDAIATVASTSGLAATSSSTPANCGAADGSATASPTGGSAPYTFLWSDGQMTATAANLAGGTYTVEITDVNGCTVTETVTVASSSSITATTSSSDENCGQANGSATVTPAGGNAPYTYIWSDGQMTATANNLAAGTYTVEITDNSGCTTMATVMVAGSSEVTLDVSSSEATCGDSNGSAAAAANGGDGSFTYIWSNGVNGVAINNVAAGNYTVSVTDGAGCTAIESVMVTGTPMVTASVAGNDVSCNGTNDGSATANPQSGTAPFSYLWSDGQNGQTANNLTPGAYTVQITDAVGCTVTETVNIGQVAPVVVMITPEDISCGAFNNGTATANPSGGTAPFTYQWSNGAAAPAIAGLSEGNYTVTVIDASGCTTVESVTIIDPNVDIVVSSSAVVVPLNNATVDFMDNTPGAVSWSWDFGDGVGTSTLQNPSYTYTMMGTYTVIVTVSNGTCTEEETIEITVEEANGITEIENLAGFEVYPNPTSGEFNIGLNLAANTDISLRVINALGQVVIQDELGAVQGETVKTYDMNAFAQGVYFITLTDGNGTATKRLFYND